MSLSLDDRHLFGAGAAACAVCCVAPLLTLLGITGAAATVATIAFAGIVFGAVVAAGRFALCGTSGAGPGQCTDVSGSVDIVISTTRTGPQE